MLKNTKIQKNLTDLSYRYYDTRECRYICCMNQYCICLPVNH